MLVIAGTDDPFALYEGGVVEFLQPLGINEQQPFEDFVDEWLANNGSELPISFERLPDIDPNDGSTVDLFECLDCDTYIGMSGEERVAEVLLYRINEGGHNWPGDWRGWGFPPAWPEGIHPVNFDISGTTVIWDFFSRHELPIPEPSSILLLLPAAVAVGLWRRR